MYIHINYLISCGFPQSSPQNRDSSGESCEYHTIDSGSIIALRASGRDARICAGCETQEHGVVPSYKNNAKRRENNACANTYSTAVCRHLFMAERGAKFNLSVGGGKNGGYGVRAYPPEKSRFTFFSLGMKIKSKDPYLFSDIPDQNT